METTAVVLAGGRSSRMGRDKLMLDAGGRTLLERVVSRFSEEFDELYLSVAEAEKYPEIAARRVVDIYRGAGPLSGLHAALKSIPGDGVFLVAADLPYACPKAAMRIIELGGDKDVCIIRLPDGRIEPLFGYYRKTLLPRCEEAITSGDYSMSGIIQNADTKYIAPDMLGELWDENLILNINYPEDYNKAALEFLNTRC